MICITYMYSLYEDGSFPPLHQECMYIRMYECIFRSGGTWLGSLGNRLGTMGIYINFTKLSSTSCEMAGARLGVSTLVGILANITACVDPEGSFSERLVAEYDCNYVLYLLNVHSK